MQQPRSEQRELSELSELSECRTPGYLPEFTREDRSAVNNRALQRHPTGDNRGVKYKTNLQFEVSKRDQLKEMFLTSQFVSCYMKHNTVMKYLSSDSWS